MKCKFNVENWEMKCQKYKDIFDILMKEYPDEKKKYPNKEKMNKERVAAKLKRIRSGFKKAMDCSKKRGGSCVAFAFFNYYDLWVSCPAVINIQISMDFSKP